MNNVKEFQKKVGGNIKARRLQMGLSQSNLGRLAAQVLGRQKPLTQANISGIERGVIDPPMTTLAAIAKGLETDIPSLYPTEEDEDIPPNILQDRLRRLQRYLEASESNAKRLKFVLSELVRLENYVQWLIEDYPDETTIPEDDANPSPVVLRNQKTQKS